MTSQFIQGISNESVETIVALWQQAINGDSNARKILLQRLTPRNAQPVASMTTAPALPSMRLIAYGSEVSEAKEDIVALWRQSVNGNPQARQALLQRIMPASALPATATILPFAAPHRQPTREAA